MTADVWDVPGPSLADVLPLDDPPLDHLSLADGAGAARRRRRLQVGAVAGALLAAGALLTYRLGGVAGAAHWAEGLVTGLTMPTSPWALLGIGVMVVLAGLHFLLATLVLRSSAGHGRVPIRTGFLAALAAGAANRVTPLGLGAAAVNTRFLLRRGLPVAGAAGAVAAAGVLGAVADALLGVFLWAVGSAVGIPGSRGEVSRLGHFVTSAVIALGHAPVWALALAAVAVVVLVVLLRRRRLHRAPGAEPALRTALRQVADLARRPADLTKLLLASAGTTAVLAVAMVVSVHAVGAGSAAGIGAVLMAYLVGAAAGNMVPVPAGIASTEAALATGLVAAGVSALHVVSAVILYRLIMFWGPVPLGLVAARSLRRRRLL